jgi:hypothetical protein
MYIKKAREFGMMIAAKNQNRETFAIKTITKILAEAQALLIQYSLTYKPVSGQTSQKHPETAWRTNGAGTTGNRRSARIHGNVERAHVSASYGQKGSVEVEGNGGV